MLIGELRGLDGEIGNVSVLEGDLSGLLDDVVGAIGKVAGTVADVAKTTCSVATGPIGQYATGKMGTAGSSITAAAQQYCPTITAMAQAIKPGQAAPAMGNAPGTNVARYPAETYYYLKDGIYHVAIPLNSGLGDFGATITHREVPVTVDPAPWGAIPLDQSLVDDKTGKTPWYKKWYILAAIGGGVVVLGGGAYYLTRRPSAPALGYSRYRW